MKFLYLIFLVLLITFSFVSAVPQLPMIITGNVTINDQQAKPGTEISAKINGEEIEKATVGDEGEFEMLLQKLGKEKKVDFYVDGIFSNQSVVYKSGNFQQLSLKVEKSYLVYYLSGGALLLISAGLIWKRKKNLKQKKK